MQIGLHLKPRHLAKLLRTSKSMKNIVDNEAYWTRVAAHAVWRESCIMGIHMDNTIVGLPEVPEGIYGMLGLERGYFWSMEWFIRRIDEVINFYSSNAANDKTTAHYKKWCLRMKSMTLAERVTEVMKVEASKFKERKLANERGMSMKCLAKIAIQYSMQEDTSGYAETTVRINTFLREIEDNPMPIAHKREVISMVQDLLFDVDISDISMGVNDGVALDIANCLRKFVQ
jgi:hypothetical protein